MPQFQGNYSDFYGANVLPFLRNLTLTKWESYQGLFTRVFDVRSTTREAEQVQGVSGLNRAQKIAEGKTVPIDRNVPLYSRTMVMAKYGLAVGTSREMVADDRFRLIKKIHESLPETIGESREIQAWNVFNRAFDTGYLGGDGKVLCATDHPLKKVGGTQGNRPSAGADLDYVPLQNALADMMGTKDHAGIRRKVPAKFLLVSPKFHFMANELTKSADRPDTANRATNSLKFAEGGMPEVISCPFLTDDDAWFLVAAPGKTGLVWWEREAPYDGSWTDDAAEIGYMAMRWRGMVDFEDWYGVYGNPGA